MLCAEGSMDVLESPNFLAQEKFDGHRAIMYVDQQGFVHFYSRRTSKVTGEKEDNTDRLKKMCAFSFSDFKDSIFDGELVMQGGNTNSSKVQQLLGSTPERAEELWDEGVRTQYKIFDVLRFKGEDVTNFPLIERILYLAEFKDYLFSLSSYPLGCCYDIPRFYYKSLNITPFKNYFTSDFLVQVDSFERELEIIMNFGGEGLILKNVQSTYKEGKRSKDWLKFKAKKTADLVVMGFEPPIKKYTGKFSVEELRVRGWQYWEGDEPVTKTYAKGWVAGLKLGAYKNGELTYVTTAKGFSDADQEFIKTHTSKMFDVVVEVEYQEVINQDTKSLRHPRVKEFRFNKDTKECLWENI
nr:MAG TPA: Thermostable DNA ligase [Caudoviricetes sp.]